MDPESRPGRLQRLLDAVVAVVSEGDPDAALHVVVERAVDLVDARYGSLDVLDVGGVVTRTIDAGRPLPGADGAGGTRATDVRSPHLWALPAVSVPISAGDAVLGRLSLHGKRDDGEFTADDETALETFATAATGALRSVVRVERSRLRERWLEALGDVRSEVMAGAGDDDVLTLVATRLVQLTRSTGGVVLVGPDDDGCYRRTAASGVVPVTAPDRWRGGPELTEVSESRGPLLGAGGVSLATGSQAWPGPWIAVPMRDGEKAVGAIVVVRPAGAVAFTPADVPLAMSFADEAVFALDVADKTRAQRRLDVVSERESIARDLHDHVVQRLFAAGLRLQTTLRRVEDDETRARIEVVVAELDDTVRRIRSVVLDPHAADGDPGLRRQLSDLVAGAAEITGMRGSLHVDGPVDAMVGPGLALDVVAVVEEGMSNAVRHSDGRSVAVTVDLADELVVQVLDDGVGIPDSATRRGLGSLAARARALGGEMSVRRRPGGGTRLLWRVPLTGGEPAESRGDGT
ncbi:MAG: histidine kinase [Pseudonocardiaceae bacterium]|nr:MAG: histidine kinase [Pseudonocardiaceae bacterium]